MVRMQQLHESCNQHNRLIISNIGIADIDRASRDSRTYRIINICRDIRHKNIGKSRKAIGDGHKCSGIVRTQIDGGQLNASIVYTHSTQQTTEHIREANTILGVIAEAGVCQHSAQFRPKGGYNANQVV